MGKKKAEIEGQSVLKSWPDSVGAVGGGTGLSLPSHFTQKTSEMSANESVGFENRECNESPSLTCPFLLYYSIKVLFLFLLQKEKLLSDKCKKKKIQIK